MKLKESAIHVKKDVLVVMLPNAMNVMSTYTSLTDLALKLALLEQLLIMENVLNVMFLAKAAHLKILTLVLNALNHTSYSMVNA